MKFSTVAAALAPPFASAQWYKGAPECAQSCLSTAWSGASGTITSFWPAQTDYCDGDSGDDVGDCISSACSASSTADAFSSYSSMSSSLCSHYESCTSAGSTGVRTVTYPGGSVTWAAPGGWGDNNSGKGFSGHGNNGEGPDRQQRGRPNDTVMMDPGSPSSYWSDWASAYSGSKTWTGGVATVTGCGAFDGSPWFVGPDCGWNGRGGFDGWVGWGSGWSRGPTRTQTVTVTTTDSAGERTTETGLATVALAVSGDLTTSQTLSGVAVATSTATGTAEPNAAAAAPRVGVPGTGGSAVTVLMAVGLGTAVAVAGMM